MRVLRGLVWRQSSSTEERTLLYLFNDVIRVVGVEGWARDLFVLSPGHQQHPEEASSYGRERYEFAKWNKRVGPA